MYTAFNALSVRDYEPPMGDLFSNVSFGSCLSLWAEPFADERAAGAPERRIIHAMTLQPHQPLHVDRIGIRRGPGYHKCGSRQDLDWIVDARLLGHVNGAWEDLAYLTDRSPSHVDDTCEWITVNRTVTGLVCEVRRSGIDGWWTPWNLAAAAFVVLGGPPIPAPRDSRLLISSDDIRPPQATERSIEPGSWRVSSADISIDLLRSRAGASALRIYGSQTTADEPNTSLLAVPAGSQHQGPFCTPVGNAPLIDTTVRCAVDGTAVRRESSVTYSIQTEDKTFGYILGWDSLSDGLELTIEKEVLVAFESWESAAWRFTFDTCVSVTSLFGKIAPEGRTGMVALPAILHAPRYGSLRIESDSPDVFLRWETNRPANQVTVEIKLAETPTENGTFAHQTGAARAVVRFVPCTPDLTLIQGAPTAVRYAISRTLHTAITFRPDTATLSNNGASIHCPICMDMWASVLLPIKDVGNGMSGSDFVRYSLERWLTGGPGYASGMLLQDGESHLAEDEYLMTGTAALLGLGMWINETASIDWVHTYFPKICQRITEMRARDLDGDGLIESKYRTGVSGTGQWSTCWLDVLSFGWKDAFSNALLYDALTALGRAMRQVDSSLADELGDWQARLKASFLPAFFNPKTGWLAGWRCKEGKLHDYAFPQLNGAAVASGVVDQELGRDMLLKLLSEMERVSVPSARFGLPGNLWDIPDHDRADIMWGFPMGYYQNGGRTHAQTRHFLDGLYAAGLTEQADALLESLCDGLAQGLTYGGNQSGVDWRYWDDRPCEIGRASCRERVFPVV